MSRLRVPAVITITEVTSAADAERSFVVTNEATGRYFAANASTVQFIQALRRTGHVGLAATEAAILPQHAKALAEKLAHFGVALAAKHTSDTPAPKAPIEGKLISLKTDLGNAANLARRMSWFGKTLYSWPALILGLVIWGYAASSLAQNTDKISASFRELTTMQPFDIFLFGTLFVALKLVHELGHILAYRTMCLAEDLSPGPIRVGIMVFAGTPFPYTDVTGAWRIKSRLRRASIGAGGIYFELWAAALLVTAWVHLDLGAFEGAIVQVAVFSGAMTVLFNLNPLIKLDGYYIVTDLLGVPNLAGRASQSAKAFLGRLLSDAARPINHWALGYWLLAYLYRWTIFAGIFWLAYRLDPRLATVSAVVSVLLLIVRPLLATLGPIRGAISMTRTAAALLGLGLALGALLVPFEDRLLVHGQINTVRSEFIHPPETVRVADGPRLEFELPDLSHDIKSLEVRSAILDVLARSPNLSAPEKAALEADASSNAARLADLQNRNAGLRPNVALASVFPMSIDEMQGQWVRTDSEPLAVVSRDSPPFLSLNVAQSRLADPMPDGMRVRLVSQPECTFDARTVTDWNAAVVENGIVQIEATPLSLPPCADRAPSGAAVVTRLAMPAASVLQRLRVRARSLLQDRLPSQEAFDQSNG